MAFFVGDTFFERDCRAFFHFAKTFANQPQNSTVTRAEPRKVGIGRGKGCESFSNFSVFE